MKVLSVGKRMKAFREQQGLSVQELSDRSGVSVRVIKEIEDMDSYPTLQPLVRLARALGQRLGTFTDDQTDNKTGDPTIVRFADRKETMVMHNENNRSETTYHYMSLGMGKTDRHMEPYFIQVMPTKEPMAKKSHEGEEFIVVVSGTLRLEYGTKTEILHEGDSTYYNSVVPHAVYAEGDKPCDIYAVIYLPQ